MLPDDFLEFLQLPLKDFIADYELQLLLTAELNRYRKTFNSDRPDHEFIPNMIEEEEDFIRLTLKSLYERNEEIKGCRDDAMKEALKKHILDGGDQPDNRKIFDYTDFKVCEKMGKTAMAEYNSYNLKLNFLLSKAQNLGFTIETKEKLRFNKIEKDYAVDLDYIDAKGSEKLVYLKETGIIDFLKEKYPGVSHNKLAKLLSAITGEKHLQPGLNAMEGNQKYTDRKSPYFSKKTVPKVESQLIHWGFSEPSPKN